MTRRMPGGCDACNGQGCTFCWDDSDRDREGMRLYEAAQRAERKRLGPSTAVILLAAANHIEEHGLHKGDMTSPLTSHDEYETAAMCLAGAVAWAESGNPFNGIRCDAMQWVGKVIGDDSHFAPSAWSDTHSKAEVVAVLRRAADLADQS